MVERSTLCDVTCDSYVGGGWSFHPCCNASKVQMVVLVAEMEDPYLALMLLHVMSMLEGLVPSEASVVVWGMIWLDSCTEMAKP